jgi:acetolactate synthase, small subunit
MKKYILSVLVEDRSGVLARVSLLFSRRGFNIHSLAVGNTEIEGISRMTIVVTGDEDIVEQVIKQVSKLIEVIRVEVLNGENSVGRELVMIKVSCKTDERSKIIEIVDIFRAKIIDVSQDSLTVEITGTEEKINALTEMLKPFKISEIVRTGLIALERGSKNINLDTDERKRY